MYEITKKIVIVVVLVSLCPLNFIQATDFTSSNFIVKDPVIEPGAGFSTSTSFQVWSSLGQEAIGLSTTTDFGLRSGFLYFLGIPQAPSGLSVVAASQSQINLSWNDNSGNETGFKIERSLTSGSGFSQIATTSANAINYPDTGLSAGTAYFYRIMAFNSDGNSSYSSQASATTQSGTAPPPSGGGGGTPSPIQTAAVFKGRAYPSADITLLKDGQVVATTKTGPDAVFEISLTNLSAGVYSFGLWAEDNKGLRSTTQSFIIAVTAGATTIISGIFLPPTISVDKTEVKRGDVLNILGQSTPQAQIAVIINSEEEILKKTLADASGVWLYKFDTLEVDYGDHSAKSRSTLLNEISSFSQLAFFKVGTKNVFAAPTKKCPPKADLNSDCKVNLVDFSIAFYWYKRTLSTAFAKIEKEKLNGDAKIDLIDFSLMAYYWTG